jgi:hypothetical protein
MASYTSKCCPTSLWLQHRVSATLLPVTRYPVLDVTHLATHISVCMYKITWNLSTYLKTLSTWHGTLALG